MKTVITLLLAFLSLNVFAETPKVCAEKAARIISYKGKARGEKVVLRNIETYAQNQRFIGFHVYVTVTGRNYTFDQVCQIVMEKYNCSYDSTYGCASSVEELDFE